MSEEIVPIVNERNEVIGQEPRSRMRENTLAHRAAYVAFGDGTGRFLTEVRTLRKDYAPGLLDACVGGVITVDESPAEAAVREVGEEIGVPADALTLHDLGVMRIDTGADRFLFGYLYLATSGSITVRQESEVSGILWLNQEEMHRIASVYAPDSLLAFDEILKRARTQGIL